MTAPQLNTAVVAVVGPDGRFDDSLEPAIVAVHLAAIAAAVTAAEAARDAAITAAAQAGGGAGAEAAAAAAAASQIAAEAAQALAEAARDAAVAASSTGGAGVAPAIAAAIALLPLSARSGSYTDLDNLPTIPNSADDIGALAVGARGTVNGVGSLNASGDAPYSEAQPGSRFDVICPGAVQPLRNTLSTRADIFFRYLGLTTINTTTGYATPGDSFVKTTL